MNLSNALKPDVAEYAAMTTYPFDPSFFRRYLLKQLHKSGVARPVVLTDQDRYHRAITREDWAPYDLSGEYYLEPISVAEVFHPKVGLTASEEQLSFVVSSANVTLNEYTTAAQLATSATITPGYEPDDPAGAAEVHVVRSIRTFLETLADEYVTGRDAWTQIRQLLEVSEWVADIEPRAEPDAQFVHNLQNPIIEQLADSAGEIEQAWLAAPFFSTGTPLGEIADTLGAEEYHVVVDPESTHVDLDAVFEHLGGDTALHLLSHSTGRWVHAKFLIVEGNWGSACLFGSPNMTGAALVNTADSGNIEAGIIRHAPNSTYFTGNTSPLVGAGAFPAQIGDPVDSKDIQTRPYPSFEGSADIVEQNIDLLDVRLTSKTNGDQLEIVADGLETEASVTLTARSGEPMVRFEWEPMNTGDERTDHQTAGDILTLDIESGWEDELVRLETADREYSNYRQVTTEAIPNSREGRDMRRTGGREGMQDLFESLLFGEQGTAGMALSQAVQSIKQHQLITTTDETGISRGEPDWGGGSARSSSSSARARHLQVKDGLSLSLKAIDETLKTEPTPEGAQLLVDHLSNVWAGCELGLLRWYIDGQLPDGIETELNTEKLTDICTEILERLHDKRVLPRVSSYLSTVLSSAKISPEQVVDGEKAFDVLFIRPALGFTLLRWVSRESDIADPFYYSQMIYRQFSPRDDDWFVPADPYIAEQLLNPSWMEAQLEAHDARFERLVTLYEDVTGAEISIPECDRSGFTFLLFTIWYRELVEYDAEEPLFDRLARAYDEEELTRLAELVTQGQAVAKGYEAFGSFGRGAFNTIVTGKDPMKAIRRLTGE